MGFTAAVRLLKSNNTYRFDQSKIVLSHALFEDIIDD